MILTPELILIMASTYGLLLTGYLIARYIKSHLEGQYTNA